MMPSKPPQKPDKPENSGNSSKICRTHNPLDESNRENNKLTLFQNSDIPGDHASAISASVSEASVLIPLIRENNNWSVLFIRRAHNDRDRHSGQVAFPGGRREESDESPIATALRETEEEIGISGQGMDLLGTLPDYLTISRFRITPVVAVVPWPNTVTLQQTEVARVFSIPLVWLQDINNLEVRPPPQAEAEAHADGASAHAMVRHSVIYYDEFDGELLWGATARMTLNLTQAINNSDIILPLPSLAQKTKVPLTR